MALLNLIRSKKKEIILFLITTLICFVILEIIVRASWYPPQDKGYPKELHIIDEILGYKLKSNYNGNFPMSLYQDKNIVVNSFGLRDSEKNYSKNVELRILGLGDSVTFGSGVNNNETYLYILQKYLEEEKLSAETINAGVSGYELSQEYNFYKKEGYKYHADIVTLGIVLNDINEPNISLIKMNMKVFGYHDRPQDKVSTKIIKNICQSCVFFYSLINNYNQIYFREIYSKWSEKKAYNLFKSRIIELNNNLTEENKKLVLIVFPYTQQFANGYNLGKYPQEKIKDIADEENITLIDLLPYLDVEDYEKYYLYGDNLHLNEEGNKLVAQVISKKIVTLIDNHTSKIN